MSLLLADEDFWAVHLNFPQDSKKKKNSVALSPQASYTDKTTNDNYLENRFDEITYVTN
jgi:hypothetical protein